MLSVVCRPRGLYRLLCECVSSKKLPVYVTLNATFTVRLVGGTSPYEGRLEVLHDGVWGTVCDNGFTVDAAKVACASVDLRYQQRAPYVWTCF